MANPAQPVTQGGLSTFSLLFRLLQRLQHAGLSRLLLLCGPLLGQLAVLCSPASAYGCQIPESLTLDPPVARFVAPAPRSVRARGHTAVGTRGEGADLHSSYSRSECSSFRRNSSHLPSATASAMLSASLALTKVGGDGHGHGGVEGPESMRVELFALLALQQLVRFIQATRQLTSAERNEMRLDGAHSILTWNLSAELQQARREHILTLPTAQYLQKRAVRRHLHMQHSVADPLCDPDVRREAREVDELDVLASYKLAAVETTVICLVLEAYR